MVLPRYELYGLGNQPSKQDMPLFTFTSGECTDYTCTDSTGGAKCLELATDESSVLKTTFIAFSLKLR